MVVTDSGWWLGIRPFLVPFLLSTAVIPWYRVQLWKSFLCLFAAADCDSTFGCGGEPDTPGGGQRLRWPRTSRVTSIIWNNQTMGIVNKRAHNLQDKGCVSQQNHFLSQAGTSANLDCWLKSWPCKSHLICPSLEGRIKSNKTAEPKSWSCSEEKEVGGGL